MASEVVAAGAGGNAGAGGDVSDAGGGHGEETMPSRSLFRIRTVTTGVCLGARARWQHELGKAVRFNTAARSYLEGLGYEVQTVRITTNPFEECVGAAACASPLLLPRH